MDPSTRKASQFETYGELLEATEHSIYGMSERGLTASDFKEAELMLLQQIQGGCLATDVAHLKAGQAVSTSGRLVTLDPEYDDTTQLFRVGGCLRQSTLLD